MKLLVTAFEGFDGRRENASWIAAQALSRRARLLRLPVEWGAPGRLLTTALREHGPDLVLSLGEGHGFTLEARARNRRKPRADNLGQLPSSPLIAADGPDELRSSAPLAALAARLRPHFPVELSTDAGQFLCEETLYTLEFLRAAADRPFRCLFAHVPEYRSKVDAYGVCNDALLQAFARSLAGAAERLSAVSWTGDR